MSPRELKPLVILVNGAGPGLGKTTLVRSLATALEQKGLTVELFSESDILTCSEFAAVMQEFRARPRVELPTLLEAAQAYLAACAQGGRDVYVLDALLPYWLSLSAWGYDESEVQQFLANLGAVAGGVRLVELYLDGDLQAGVLRAAAREGAGWIESQIAKISGFPQVGRSPRNGADVAAYYRAASDERAAVRFAAPWPTYTIDARRSQQECLDESLRLLDAHARPSSVGTVANASEFPSTRRKAT
jgi:hypothetical protein